MVFRLEILVSFGLEVIRIFSAIKIKEKYDFLEKEYYEEYERVNVYAIRDDKNSYPHFLIYENGEWKYVSAKHFKPVDEDR